MKRNLTILLLFMSFLVSAAQETTILSNNGQKKLLQIYQSPGNDFLSLMTQPEKPTPENEYLRLYNLFIAYQSHERSLYADRFHMGIAKFESAFDSTPLTQLMHVTLLIQESLLYWNQKEMADGARSFYKAHRLFRKLDKKQYSTDYLKLQAIFNIFLSQIPESFQFLASLLGLEGNIYDGFQQLKEYALATKQQPGSFCEALVLQAYCQLKFGEPSEKQVHLLLNEVADCSSPLLHFIAGSLAIKNKMSNEGLAVIVSMNKQAFEAFPLLHYAHGRLLLNQLDSECIPALQAFDDNYPGHSFKTDALMRQAWWFHLQKQETTRDSLIAQVLLQEQLPTSNDQQAHKEITALASTPLALLKARILYDGSHFKQAKQVLDNTNRDDVTPYYLPEYYYRLGKINLTLQEPTAALSSFDRVIGLSQDDTRYFGPYAAIEAAKIQLAQHDSISAQNYLEAARQLNTGEYKQDIARAIASFDKH